MLAELCPKCGSNKIKGKKNVRIYGQTVEVDCLTCGWKGKDSDLLVMDLGEGQSFSDAATDLTKEVIAQFTLLLSKYMSEPVVLALVQSGLIAPKDTERLQRLATKSIEAVWQAVIDDLKQEDQKQAKEVGKDG